MPRTGAPAMTQGDDLGGEKGEKKWIEEEEEDEEIQLDWIIVHYTTSTSAELGPANARHQKKKKIEGGGLVRFADPSSLDAAVSDWRTEAKKYEYKKLGGSWIGRNSTWACRFRSKARKFTEYSSSSSSSTFISKINK